MRLWRTAIERGRRLASSPVAGETYWALALDALNLFIMLLSFTLLGKQLGPAGFGNYAAMYAVIGVLNGLVSTGTSLNVVQLLVRDRLDLQFVLRASLGLVGLLGLLAVVVGTAVAHLTVPGLTVPVLLSFMVAELLGAAVAGGASAVILRDDGTTHCPKTATTWSEGAISKGTRSRAEGFGQPLQGTNSTNLRAFESLRLVS